MAQFPAYNPASSIQGTDLLILERSPFSSFANTLKFTPPQITSFINSSPVLTTNTNLAVNTKYMSNGGSLLTHTLPTNCNVGDEIWIWGMGTGLFRISQNTGQQVFMGIAQTTSGTGGSVVSTQKYDVFIFKCNVANTSFILFASGNPTLN